jgi:hypothetical protein
MLAEALIAKANVFVALREGPWSRPRRASLVKEFFFKRGLLPWRPPNPILTNAERDPVAVRGIRAHSRGSQTDCRWQIP